MRIFLLSRRHTRVPCVAICRILLPALYKQDVVRSPMAARTPDTPHRSEESLRAQIYPPANYIFPLSTTDYIHISARTLSTLCALYL